jgi:cellulose synthase/poly-beta-1,6-N-acetylglucosamine synthase-like glycosyltransferase
LEINNLKVSIIIPFQKENDYLVETIQYINKLNYKNIEVILLPDLNIDNEFIKNNLKNIKFEYQVVTTEAVSPAIKRDIGADKCNGEILAFIDDDAYPSKDWLDKLLAHFKDENICAVGGPQITPSNDTFWQKVSGAMFLSALNGKAVDRYWQGENSYEVDDWPSVNLLVRKDDFLDIDGFDNSYWPGEDTKLCHDLVQNGKKIIYEPNAVVYHHRRSGFKRHIRQVGNYGLHRGHFAKKYPQTSLKVIYVIPSLFFIFIIAGWLMLFFGTIAIYLYEFMFFLYSLAIILSIFSIYKKTKNFKIAITTIPYTIGTHFWYGYKFIRGYFTKNLKESLGR